MSDEDRVYLASMVHARTEHAHSRRDGLESVGMLAGSAGSGLGARNVDAGVVAGPIVGWQEDEGQGDEGMVSMPRFALRAGPR